MKKILTLVGVALLLTAPLARAQLGSSTGTTTVSVAVGAEAALNITNSSTPLTSAGTNFTNYTGSTGLTYFVRTTQSGGSGSITLKVTSDFSPANGPSVTTPPNSGDKLAYTCTLTGAGTACSSSVTASTSSSTSVATFGADAHTVTFPGGDTATTAWTLTNDPKYKTGSYSATVTFTISAS
ncbi:MAG: hypothetical protein ABSC21_15465 [Terriglobia bacterium]|jgi:hypothetical protein